MAGEHELENLKFLGGGESICLSQDVVLTRTFRVEFDVDIRIDGQGLYTLSGDFDGPLVRFDNGGQLLNLRVQNLGSGEVLDVTGDTTLRNVYACGLDVGSGKDAFHATGTADVSHVVFEDTKGGGTLFDLGAGTIDHATITGASVIAVDGLGGVVTNSLVGLSVSGGWLLDVSSPPVTGVDFLQSPDWACAEDARPSVDGVGWGPSGHHLGGYTDESTLGVTPFAGWNDDDSDTYAYGPVGGAAEDWDCDDDDPAIHPDADELCDAIDNDCDGEVDEEPEPLTAGAVQGFVDVDGDGVGSEEVCWVCNDLFLEPTCVDVSGDCDDEDPAKVAPEDCVPPDTGTPMTGHDDDDIIPGDDDDTPGDDDDDGPTTDGTLPDDTRAGFVGAAADGCQCAFTSWGGSLWSWARRRRSGGSGHP